MNRVDVVSFGGLIGSPELETLFSGSGWKVAYIDGRDFLRVEDRNAPAVVLVVLGNQALRTAPERAELLARLGRTTQLAQICLIGSSADSFDAEFYSNFDDFIFWPCSKKEMQARLGRLIRSSASPHSDSVHARLLEDFAAMNLVGQSRVFLKLLEFIKKIARCDATVLIEGETGTGKENAARAIHYLSERRENAFIPVNCGAIPDNLMESELFGHDKGAFTDANADRPGLVELAAKGTLFLDEVNSLSLKAQAALLRFIQTHEYRPLGGRRLKHADVPVVVATNADLVQKVETGEFRRDLLFRLNVLALSIPPLRERTEDIAAIAKSLLIQFAAKYRVRPKTLHPRSLEWLKKQYWPGNVRELENVLLRKFLLAEGHVIKLTDRDDGTDSPPDRVKPTAFHKAKEAAINAFEIDYLNKVLEMTAGNVTEAAKIAGKERRAFGKLIKKYNVDKSGYHNSKAS